MNIVMELALIFGVCLVGVIVASIMPFAVPYSVISLLILMTLLYQKADVYKRQDLAASRMVVPSATRTV